MADPTYKPIPKGAGMRVGTDDVTQTARKQAVSTSPDTQDVADDAASIWKVASQGSDDQVGTEDGDDDAD
jgi:hypothetical protein